MFAQTMVAAIDAARTLTQLDHLSTDIWKAWGSGQIGDEAQLLAMQLETRRKALRGDLVPVGIPPGRTSIFPPRRPQRAPMRAVAIARRRHLAASGPMPPPLASRFTTGELAVLRIVGDEVRAGGQCALCIDAIAARAGVCRRLAQNAIRQAARLGLLTIQERRREGQKNLSNVLRVVSREWLSWLRIGCKKIQLMPIHARYHRWFYPIDWPQLSAVIRFRRAQGKCEGCGSPVNRLWNGTPDRLPIGTPVGSDHPG